jgi:hypothetical protein
MISMMASLIAATAATQEGAIMARLIELGNEDEVMTGDVVVKRLVADRALFAEIVEKAGIVPQ